MELRINRVRINRSRPVVLTIIVDYNDIFPGDVKYQLTQKIEHYLQLMQRMGHLSMELILRVLGPTSHVSWDLVTE